MSVAISAHLHLAVALDGAGWHPAAWREPSARPTELLTAGYWQDLVGEAERATLDFVTFEDSLRLPSDDATGPRHRVDRVRGRLDAVSLAARLAPVTAHIGLVPTVTVTHTEPFHISKAIATLDYVSTGRAGLRARTSTAPDEAAHVGRRPATSIADDPLGEAADCVEVLRRLWDSWEDDAEIRDVATGRFIDRNKLHYIDFAGRWFSVRGPSITPRPPQGQPIVAVSADTPSTYPLVAGAADVAFVTPSDAADAARLAAAIRAAERGRPATRIFGDLLVFLDDSEPVARQRRQRLDELAGESYRGDATVFAGTPAGLADLLLNWREWGLTGFRLKPAALPHDLLRISRSLVPELRARGAFRTRYEASTLRGLLGLPRPRNRYAADGVAQ